MDSILCLTDYHLNSAQPFFYGLHFTRHLHNDLYVAHIKDGADFAILEDGEEDENYQDEIAAFKKIIDEQSPATSQTFMQAYQSLATALQSICSPSSTIPTLPKSAVRRFLILNRFSLSNFVRPLF